MTMRAMATAVADTVELERTPCVEFRWGVTSETGRLTDVLLSAPPFLRMVPCNDVTRDSLAQGLRTSPMLAARQHRDFADALREAGVRCHFVAPQEAMADLSFTRDAVMMSPWGLIELRPAAEHRQAETRHVAAAARRLGVPFHARVERGRIEGGDVCLLRDGLMAIGVSDDRTDEAGATALGEKFEQQGWQVLKLRIDPKYLHLDTILTLVEDGLAVACPEALGQDAVDQLRGFGLTVIEASEAEVARLGANLLSLGDRRVMSPRDNRRLNAILSERGLDVIEVSLDQFTRCGGGAHCLTMPLAREA